MNELLVVGMGWVGQANALAFVKQGWFVYAKDIQTVANIYNDPDLSKVAFLTPGNTCKFTCDAMVCVNVPNNALGSQWDGLAGARKALADARALTSGPVILRSTVLPVWLHDLDFDFYVPEFLHERLGVAEAMRPEMLVIGRKTEAPLPACLTEMNTWVKDRIFLGNAEQAAAIKYLANAYNALRVAFVNEFGDKVKIPGVQSCIDFLFQREPYLRYGRAYGGDCLVKDTEALACYYQMEILLAAHFENRRHGDRHDLPELHFGDGQ